MPPDLSTGWLTLLMEAARLALHLLLILAFLWGLSLILGRNWNDLARFLEKAVKAEFTKQPGWLDLALCVLFGACVFVPPISEQLLLAFGVAELSSNDRLLNSDLKTLAMAWVVTASLIFVGSTSK